MSKPWDNIISEDEQNAYNAAGFGRPTGMGQRPALLVIDVQYRTVGTVPRSFWESIKEFPTSCGDVGWRAVKQIERLLAVFRSNGWPVLYPYVSPKETFDRGRLSDKVPAIMNIAQKGYEFVAEVAPRTGHFVSQETSERVLRHAARELSHQCRGRQHHGDRLHHQRLRARHRRRRFFLQFPGARSLRRGL